MSTLKAYDLDTSTAPIPTYQNNLPETYRPSPLHSYPRSRANVFKHIGKKDETDTVCRSQGEIGIIRPCVSFGPVLPAVFRSVYTII